jgi:hypothetical protein
VQLLPWTNLSLSDIPVAHRGFCSDYSEVLEENMIIMNRNDCPIYIKITLPAQFYDAKMYMTVYFKNYTWNYNDQIYFSALNAQNITLDNMTIDASPSDFYNTTNQYRQQSVSARIPEYTTLLKVFSLNLTNPWSISNISLRILHCPEGSQKISSNKCECKAGYFKDYTVSDLVCLECPIHCNSCTGRDLNQCDLQNEYKKSKHL